MECYTGLSNCSWAGAGTMLDSSITRAVLVTALILPLGSCGRSQTDESVLGTTTDEKAAASPRDDHVEAGRPGAPLGSGESPVSTVGTVASVKLPDKERSKHYQGRLHFCIFENGETDLIYVGTKYGMWSSGEFDLSIGDGFEPGEVVFTGKVNNLVYGGVILNMGDVLSEQPRSNIGVYITRITGWFK